MKKIVGLCGAMLLIPALMLIAWDALTSDLISARLMKKNPQRSHEVEVVKNTRNNIWFRIKLDGEVLHTTPRFARALMDFREEIIWAPDGQRFLFEVADQPLYGYDLKEERELTAEELFALPRSPFSQTGYYGTVPAQIDPDAPEAAPVGPPVPFTPPWLTPSTNPAPEPVQSPVAQP